MSVPTKYDEAIIDRICDQLASGKSLSVICREPGTPDRRTIQRWLQGDDELAGRLLEAREAGFHQYAEETLELVEKEPDANRARVILYARQWYLGKLSNAFREKPVAVGVQVNVDVGDTFDAIARVLNEAAGRISSSSSSTRLVDATGTAGPGDAAGRLADLAGDGGERLGEDSGRG